MKHHLQQKEPTCIIKSESTKKFFERTQIHYICYIKVMKIMENNLNSVINNSTIFKKFFVQFFSEKSARDVQ